MNDQESVEFRGFDENLVQSSLHLCCIYVNTVDRLERNFTNFVSNADSGRSSRMDLSVTKCFEEITNSCNTSFRGIAGDNDSGYISQNVESNSSVETAGDNRQLAMATSNVKDVYLNEDTLFEKPQIFANQAQHGEADEEYEEFGHLFFMTSVPGTPILNSSVASQKTNYSGFEGDESGVSDVSATIPIATPIKVHPEQLNGESESDQKINNASEQNVEPVSNVESMGESKGNDRNFVNVEDNLKAISPTEENMCSKRLNFSLNPSESENNMNCIQTRMMDANNCNMSLFESFYSFLCDLYITKDAAAEDLANVSINPKNLQITNSQVLENSPSKSPYKNSYVELETKSKLIENNGTDAVTSSDAAPNTDNDDEIIVLDSPIIGRSTNNVTLTSNLEANKMKHPLTALKDHKLKNKKKEADQVDSKAIENARSTPLSNQSKIAVNTPMSPELFSDEEPEPSEVLSHSMTQLKKTCDQLYITKNDRKLLKRANESLGGVPPPPSVTIMQMSVIEMLQKITDNKHLFTTNIENVNNSVDNYVNCVHKESVNTDKVCDTRSKSMDWPQDRSSKIVEKRESLLVTCKNGDFDSQLWPDVMQYRYHGLHYNRSKISEEFEHLCVKHAVRYVGAETQSSCTVFGSDILSPSKRRFRFKRMAKSPGKRLSHLARRRITFSKDSLQSGSTSSNCSFIGARTRQIMVDARKYELLSRRKSPRKKSPRKTPGKSPRRKAPTPNSSSKKSVSMWLKRSNAEDSLDSVSSASSRASVTKRALFQSPPDREESSNSVVPFLNTNTSDSDLSESSRRRTPRRALFTSPFKASPSKMTISSLYPAKRKLTPKRSLFKSPGKASPAKLSEVCDKKRKRIESDDVHPSKIAKGMSVDVKNTSSESKSRSLTRSHSSSSSSTLQSQDMAEHRKKKLMWAVAEALRSQNIDLKHPQFKVFASVLARVIRHFLPNLFTNGPRPEGSTTESMLRIARQYVFAVTRGKTVDQIIREAHHNSRLKTNKPSGYVALDKASQPDNLQMRNKENVLQDRVNIIGSGRTATEVGEANKNRRGENVERIRRVINFGDDDDNTGVR